MTNIIRLLSTIKVFHFILTRYGSEKVRRICFDEKFASGEWNFACEQGEELVTLVKHYARNGKILVLGCGTASLCQLLPDDSYEEILGIDISKVAITEASKRGRARMRFVTADIVKYRYEGHYNVILFSESIYYCKQKDRRNLLQTCKNHLTSNGVIIVTISYPLRFNNILNEIREGYQVLEDRNFKNTIRYLIVFK